MSVGPQLFAELPGLLVSFRREGAQLVRLAGRCFGMADEDKAHGGVGYLDGGLSVTWSPTCSPTRR